MTFFLPLVLSCLFIFIMLLFFNCDMISAGCTLYNGIQIPITDIFHLNIFSPRTRWKRSVSECELSQTELSEANSL